MTTPVITVSPQASVADLAALMLKHRISGAPVVDGKGRLQGIVSEGDLIRRIGAQSQRERSWWLSLLINPDEAALRYVKSRGLTARDVMTRVVVTVGERTPIGKIAALLEQHHIKRVPVVRGGDVVGIVSRANLLHGLAAQIAGSEAVRTDRRIRSAVLKELDHAGVDRYPLNVIVSNGVVEFWGFVDSATQKRALSLAAGNVNGFRKVADNTTVPTPMLRASLGAP